MSSPVRPDVKKLPIFAKVAQEVGSTVFTSKGPFLKNSPRSSQIFGLTWKNVGRQDLLKEPHGALY